MDDTILPRKSIVEEALGLKTIIRNHMEASRQKVNELKSEIVFINTRTDMEQHICKIMGYKKGLFPYKYLKISLGERIEIK